MEPDLAEERDDACPSCAQANDGDGPPIACSLDGGQLDGRLDEWHRLLDGVVERESLTGGVRLRFGPATSAATVADLAAREQACCAFFEFVLRITTGGVILDVCAPEEARSIVEELFGTSGRQSSSAGT